MFADVLVEIERFHRHIRTAQVRFKSDQKSSIIEVNLLTEHFGSTHERFVSNGKSLDLVLHDTT